MFTDYYALLEIDATVQQADIKQAFRKQAFKWHPDRHPHKDTTERMKAINEAYLILKDPIARARYDNTYWTFKASQEAQSTFAQPNTSKTQQQHVYDYYTIKDTILKTWIERAKKQAADLVQQTIKDFRGMTAAGAKGIAKGAGEQFVAQLMVSLIFLIGFMISKACN